MVYECPQCKTALPPGSGVCPNCGLKFETPTPLDATLPPPSSQPAPPPYASALPSGGMMGGATALPMEEMPAASSGGAAPTRNVIAAVVALCAVLIVVAIFAVKMFVQQEASTNVPPPAPSVTPRPSPVGGSPLNLPPRSAPITSTVNQAPVVFSPGSGGGARSAGVDAGALVGRWQAKSSDYYVFGGDGSGYRGNLNTGKRDAAFSWVLVNNQLILNGAKHEEFSYNSGPNADTMYLRTSSGRYDAYSRIATQ